MTDGHNSGGHDTESRDDAPETTKHMPMMGGRRQRRKSVPPLRDVPRRPHARRLRDPHRYRHVATSDHRRLGFLGSLAAFALAGFAVLAVGVSSVTSNAASSGFGGCGPYTPLAPIGSGVVRPVSNQAELSAAMAAAQPGDTINLASGRYREIHYREVYGHRSGTLDQPIVIQAAAGAEAIIDWAQVDDPQLKPVVDIDRREHIEIRGLIVRNRSFGLRSAGSSHVIFEHNDVAEVGHSGVVAQVYNNDPNRPSTSVTIRCNRIHDTGRVAPEYGEGIYIGTGSVSVPDPTSNILIEGNDIYRTSNEGIDVKHHVTDVTIRHNDVHDLTPYYGGAISLGLNSLDWGPADYRVENNRIWNVSSGRHYAQAIAIGHGPTIIRDNLIWGIESETTSSWPWIHPIQIHGDDSTAAWAYGFGNPAANQVEITGNTVVGCQVACIDSFTDPGAVAPSLTMGVNVVTAASSRGAANDNDRLVSEADFIGPTSGTADAGSGPGSGLALVYDTSPTSLATTTSTTSPTSSTTSSEPTTTSPPTTTTSASTLPATSSTATTSGSTTIAGLPTTTTITTTTTENSVDTTEAGTGSTDAGGPGSDGTDPTTTTGGIGPAGATTTTVGSITVPETTTTTVRPHTTAIDDRPGRRTGWKLDRGKSPNRWRR
jgi:hypothetical protein